MCAASHYPSTMHQEECHYKCWNTAKYPYYLQYIATVFYSCDSKQLYRYVSQYTVLKIKDKYIIYNIYNMF